MSGDKCIECSVCKGRVSQTFETPYEFICEACIARLRRLADVGAEGLLETIGDHIWSCHRCKRYERRYPVLHAHDCDAAIHLGLERETEP